MIEMSTMARKKTALLLISLMLGCPFLCMADSESCVCCGTPVACCDSCCHESGCPCPEEKKAPTRPNTNCACQGAIAVAPVRVIDDHAIAVAPVPITTIDSARTSAIFDRVVLEGPCHFPPWISAGKIGTIISSRLL